MAEAGLITLVSRISPSCSRARDAARKGIGGRGVSIETYVKASLKEVTGKRDVKGLYTKARSGQLKNFTGIDSPYE